MTAATPSPTVANGSVATQRPSPTSGRGVGEGRGPVDPLIAQLRDLRIKAGLSQRALAAAMLCVQSNVTMLEAARTNPTLSTLRRWAAALGYEIALVPVTYHVANEASSPDDTVSLIATPGRPLRPGESNLGDVPPTLNPNAIRDAYGLGPHPTTPCRGNNSWAFCACGHAWINHDVEEYVGDDSDTCCVEGCDQNGCPGKAVARTLDVAEQTAAMAREAGR